MQGKLYNAGGFIRKYLLLQQEIEDKEFEKSIENNFEFISDEKLEFFNTYTIPIEKK